MSLSSRDGVVLLVGLVAVTALGTAVVIDWFGESSPQTTVTDAADSGASPTPTIGREDGIRYDDALAVDSSDGLNDTELDAYVSRGMARVERLRDAEFEERVNVTVMNRSEYQSTSPFTSVQPDRSRWNNQVWEALFITGGSENVSDEFTTVFDDSVVGYYAPTRDAIVIVTESSDSLLIDEATLIHELTHALQDQRHDLTKPRFTPPTQDQELAVNGLVEGEANYIQQQYEAACAAGDYPCLNAPSQSGDTSSSTSNIGLQMVLYQPYDDGPQYIAQLVETQGWDAVDDAFQAPPTTSSRIIHQQNQSTEYTFPPIHQPDTAWSRYPSFGTDGADSVGEASVFVMLWYQNYKYQAETIPRQSLSATDGSQFSYDHPLSEGLVDDRLVPYATDQQNGYIWRLKWQSPQDAAAFADAYRSLLTAQQARQRSATRWTIPSGGFAGAYSVHTDGSVVRIAHAPSQSALTALTPD